MMFVEEINHNKELFSGSSREMGKIHWYIQKARTEMDKKCWIKRKKFFGQDELTDFGKEVGVDEIHWWVFKKERKIEDLLKRTEDALKSVQKLKEDSFLLKEKYYPKSYADLIKKIKEFTKSHTKEIHTLYDYVVWLHKKDPLAPCILFTYRVWGSTRLSDRTVEVTANTIDEDHETVNICTEVALGLRTRLGYTLEKVYLDIISDAPQSIDSEYQGSISVSMQRVLIQASHEILDEFATYFEFLRQSLRNIILEIKRYNAQTELLCRESFWRSFIKKAMSQKRIETQLWDFKETLEMWHTKHKEKEEAEIKFCEQIASFANTKGGVLIIGITDKPPRKIVGIQNLEKKVFFTKKTLKRYINYDTEFTHFQQILMKDSGEDKSCLIIAVAQTRGVIGVKDKSGKISYPIRLETGLDRSDYDKIKKSKINVLRDNYNFILNLERFLHDK